MFKKSKLAKVQSRRAKAQPRDKNGRFVEGGRTVFRKDNECKLTPAGTEVYELKTETVAVGGRKYKIPVDDRGYVPQYALAARFTNVREGTGPKVERRNIATDQNTEAKTIYKGKLKPEDVKEWWARPNKSDVEGVDDIESTYFDLSALKTQGRKEAHGKIAVVGGTKKDQEKIRKMLSESFTLKEQKEISKEGVTIEITDIDDAGQYHGKRDGMTYLIRVNPDFLDDDTLLHETIHHSRMVDPSRKTKLTSSRSKSRERVIMIDKDVSLEEAATVAETAVRQGGYTASKNPSYYGILSKDKKTDPFEMMREDRILLAGSSEVGSSGLKGKRAISSVERNFENSHISDLNLKGYNKLPDKKAKDRLKELK